MIGTAQITVKANGSVIWRGVDAGPLTVHHILRGVLVLKAATHKFWSGRFSPQATAPATFYVFTITSETAAPGGDKEFTCESVVDFPLRKAK